MVFKGRLAEPAFSAFSLPVALLFFLLLIFLPDAAYPAEAVLLWGAPESNIDGTPLTELAGYKIYYGDSPGDYTTSIDAGNVTTFTASGMPVGNLYLAVTAYDAWGNESDYSNEVPLIIPLLSTVTDPVDGAAITTASYIIKGTASNAGISKVEVGTSGPGGTAWHTAAGTHSWSYSWNPASDGAYTITTRATDSAGIVEVPGAGVTVTVDRTRPSSSVTTPAAGSAVNRDSGKYYIIGTAADACTGIKVVEVSTDGGYNWSEATGASPWSCAWTLPPADGLYKIISRATDNAGNIEALKQAVNVIIDGVKPASKITSPAAGASLKGSLKNGNIAVKVTGTASDNGSGVKQVALSFDGGATWSNAVGTVSWYYIWSLPAQGDYTVISRATDNAGNNETTGAGIPVKIDKAGPVSAITSPADGAFLKGSSAVISGTAADTVSGIKKVEVSINNGRWRLAAGTGAWSYTWTLPANRICSVRSRATDKAGNVESPVTASVSVKVDKTAPTVTVTSPLTGANMPGALSSYSIKGTAAEYISGTGLDKVCVSTDGGATWAEASKTASVLTSKTKITNWAYVWTPAAEGSYVIKARASDLAGNVRTAAGPTVKVDKTPPSAAVTAPADGATVTGPYTYIRGTAADGAGSSVKKVEVSINGGAWAPAAGTASWKYYWKPPANGIYTVKARATDRSGNVQDPGAGPTVTVAN